MSDHSTPSVTAFAQAGAFALYAGQEGQINLHKPWAKQRPDYQYRGPIGWDNNRLPEIGEPYTPDDLLEFLACCRQEVPRCLGRTAFAVPSGFSWLPCTKLALHIYTIPHFQQHKGELGARLSAPGIETPWIVSASDV